ncbi:MAG TPA: GIY-YIG nuclease family protein [Oscillatoriales cyanobacterium M59_W2019_021]|nr:GIY-YIG nuclease family protein [Oscillatoriales cyanobacterium M4454_W2019_049]HIK52428.1 GIY-YIG nuclease family protein [Oscillatoriales cyanobacterium M59_W2019_021]
MFLDPFQLPFFALSQVKALPNCTAIYFAIDSHDRILYIGQATNLATRWKNHHRRYQLEDIDRKTPVRIAWVPWNQEGLTEAETLLIKSFQPLLNGTEVKSPEIIPAEIVLHKFLNQFSRRLIAIGFEQNNAEKPPNIHLKYDWTNCSSDGTAAKIKRFIQDNSCPNTSFKIERKPYGKIIPCEVIRPGSRLQKVNARQNRSYNNHWRIACNGVFIHITPTNYYKEIKSNTDLQKLANIRIRTVMPSVFAEFANRYPPEFSGLSCWVRDLVPRLWQ